METTLLTADQARELLAPVHDPFARSHQYAWDQWLRLKDLCVENDAADLILPLTATTRANFVNNHCVSMIQETVSSRDDFYVTQTGGLFTAVVAAREDIAAFVRFKFLNWKCEPQNVATKVQRALGRQEWPDNLFSELPTAATVVPTVLTCGYRLNLDESDIQGIHICCHYKRQLVWQYDISEDGAAGQVIDFPPLPDSPPLQARVTSKIDLEGEAAEEGEES